MEESGGNQTPLQTVMHYMCGMNGKEQGEERRDCMTGWHVWQRLAALDLDWTWRDVYELGEAAGGATDRGTLGRISFRQSKNA